MDAYTPVYPFDSTGL